MTQTAMSEMSSSSAAYTRSPSQTVPGHGGQELMDMRVVVARVQACPPPPRSTARHSELFVVLLLTQRPDSPEFAMPGGKGAKGKGQEGPVEGKAGKGGDK